MSFFKSFFVKDFPEGTTEGPGKQLDLFEEQKKTGEKEIAETFDFDDEVDKMYKEGRTDEEYRKR